MNILGYAYLTPAKCALYVRTMNTCEPCNVLPLSMLINHSGPLMYYRKDLQFCKTTTWQPLINKQVIINTVNMRGPNKVSYRQHATKKECSPKAGSTRSEVHLVNTITIGLYLIQHSQAYYSQKFSWASGIRVLPT